MRGRITRPPRTDPEKPEPTHQPMGMSQRQRRQGPCVNVVVLIVILASFVIFLCVISSDKSMYEIEKNVIEEGRREVEWVKGLRGSGGSGIRNVAGASEQIEGTKTATGTKYGGKLSPGGSQPLVEPSSPPAVPVQISKPPPLIPPLPKSPPPKSPPPKSPPKMSPPADGHNPATTASVLMTKNDKCPLGIVALTYATHPGKDDRFCRALHSSIQHKVPLRVLGWGKPWTGLTQKLTGSLEFLRKLPDQCTVVFTDAYDILYADDLNGIKLKFDAETDKDVIFAGECGCWPQITRDRGKGDVCLHEYPDNNSKYKYLNSGQWIATQPKALEIFEALIAEAPKYAERYKVEVKKINDQEMVSDMYMQSRYGITLDKHSNIFQAMHATHDRPLAECDPWPDMTIAESGCWHNKDTNTNPSIFHFNGGGKIHHLAMEKEMWYMNKGKRVGGTECESKFGGKLEADEVRKTQILMGDDGEERYFTFDEICPQHPL